MAVEGPLGLKIPKQTRTPADAFLIDPAKTKAWIAELPLANVGETSRRVFKAVVDCNRTNMSPAIRSRVMEAFRESIVYVEKNLQKHYIGASFPLASKSRKIALLNRELHAEMAISQKIIIADLFANQSGRFDREALDRAIQKTLDHARNTLLHSYLAHEPCPRYTWREIHRLAAYGFPNSLLANAVSTDADPRRESIYETYIRILLLALSAPYNLRQREILAINEKIDTWSKHARLLKPTPIQECNDHTGLFLAELASDSPPQHLSLVGGADLKHCVVLDTRGLLAHLKSMLGAETSKTKGLADTEGALLKKLHQSWSGAPKRQHPRTALHFELKIAAGLNAIWELLSAGRSEHEKPAPSATGGGGRAVASDRGWREQTDMLEHTLKSGFLKTGGEGALSLSPLDDDLTGNTNQGLIRPTTDVGPDDDTIDVWSAHNPASFATHVVRTIDESAGGYRVSWTGEDVPQVTLGELIGIQSPTDDAQYALAAVRWVKNVPDKGLELGMQLLARDVLPVEQLPEPKKGQQSKHCLLVPGLRAAAKPASLVCPALGFQAGDTFVLKAGVRTSHIRLTRCLEQTGAFAQFLYEPADQEKKNGSSGSEFDSLWSEL